MTHKRAGKFSIKSSVSQACDMTKKKWIDGSRVQDQEEV